MRALYLKIATPRIPKISFFLVYMSTTIAGLVACLNLPVVMIQQLGQTLVTAFGIFIFAGSLLGAFGVFPAVHWMERGGILLVMTSVIMYTVMLVSATGTTIALWLVIPLIFTLGQRFYEITWGSTNQNESET